MVKSGLLTDCAHSFPEFFPITTGDDNVGMLKNFEDAQSEISDIGIREAFIDGFRLGARLMLAALSEDDGELRSLI